MPYGYDLYKRQRQNRSRGGIGHVGQNPGSKKKDKGKKGGKKGKGKGGSKAGAGWLVDFLTPKTFRREMRAAENLQYRPLQRQLTRELKASQFRRNKEIPQWFEGYQQDLARLRGESQGAYNSAMDRVSQFANEGGAQDAAMRNDLMASLQADAAQRGTTFDPSAIAGLASAEGARRNVTASTLGTIAGQGANQFAYLSNRQGIAGQAEGEARQRELARALGIQSDRRALARERGDFRTEFGRTAREDERKYLLERLALRSKDKYAKALIKQAKLGIKEKATPSKSTVVNKYKGLKGDKDSGGVSAREAKGYISSASKKDKKNVQSLISYLTNRGVDAKIARKVARRWFRNNRGRGGGGGSKPNTSDTHGLNF